MEEREMIKLLLEKNNEIAGKINNAVIEIMRLGMNSEREKKIVPDTIESIRYSLDRLESLSKNV